MESTNQGDYLSFSRFSRPSKVRTVNRFVVNWCAKQKEKLAMIARCRFSTSDRIRTKTPTRCTSASGHSDKSSSFGATYVYRCVVLLGKAQSLMSLCFWCLQEPHLVSSKKWKLKQWMLPLDLDSAQVVVVWIQVWVTQGRGCMESSNFGSVRSDWAGIATYEGSMYKLEVSNLWLQWGMLRVT